MEELKAQDHHSIFRQELLNYSIADEYTEAIKEWRNFDSYESEKQDECICTKKIYNIFLIENKYSKSILKIGSECNKHINKAEASEAKKAYEKKRDMKKNPHKYCSTCKEKFKKVKNKDEYYCKCISIKNEYLELKEKGQTKKFTFGKYQTESFIKHYKNYNYISWMESLKTPNVNMTQFINWKNNFKSIKTEYKKTYTTSL